jgi:hypothetical protein
MKTIISTLLLSSFAAIAAEADATLELIPAYGKIPPTFWEQHKVAIIIGGFLFIIAQSLLLWKLLMRLQPPVEPPENLARAALNQLLDEAEDGRLLSEVSQILRRYIGAAFKTRGEELTTSEFTSEIAANEVIGKELAERVSKFLRECDVLKFTPRTESNPIDAVEQALELVTQLQSRLAPADPAK